MNIETAFSLGLEFSNLVREEMKIIRQSQQTYPLRIESIQSRKSEILNLIYEERIKSVIK